MKSVLSHRVKLLLSLLCLFSATSASAAQGLEVTWSKEGVDWSQYSAFYLKPLDISEVKIVRPPWAEDDPRDWNFNSANPDQVKAIFRDNVKDALERGDGYQVVHGPGKGVLEIDVEILSVMPYVRPGSEKEDGYQLMTLGSGEMTARVELRDSNTRELLLLAEGDTVVGDDYKPAGKATNVENLSNKFGSFGARLRQAMDTVHGK
jgi:hypothetical protein